WEKESGINLCNPRLDLKYTIAMSLLNYAQEEGMANATKPKCDLAEVVKNWQGFLDTVDLPGMSLKGEGNKAVESILQGLQEGMRPGNSDATITLTMNDKLISKRSTEEDAARFRAEGKEGSAIGKTNTTDTEVKTPAALVQRVGEMPITMAEVEVPAKSDPAALNITGVLARAFSTFTNSLASQLLQRWIREGLYNLTKAKNAQVALTMPPCPSCAQQPPRPGATLDGAELAKENIFTQPITPEAIENYYDGMFTVSVGTSELYNPLLDFSFCPEQKELIGINNCVLDQKWYNLFDRNEFLTLQQAIDLKLVDPKTPLIAETDARNGDIQYCFKQGLCFSNLQKMRLARLIPLGWEIAASKSDGSVTLGQVIDCFDNVECELNTKRSDHFEKLIDPDWLLKSPTAICRAKGYGPKLQAANVAARAEVCADAPTCLKENDFASCQAGAYGYCTREKNVWRFGGEQCSPQYASCRSYEQQGSTNYWIKDSLEYCTADQVGCRWYSRTKEIDRSAGAETTIVSPNLATDICDGTSRLIYPDAATVSAFCKLKGYADGQIKTPGETSGFNTWCQHNGNSWVTSSANRMPLEDINCYGLNWTNSKVVYLNGQAKSCVAKDAGCQQLLKVDASMNLLANGDFKLDDDGNSRPDGWNELNWSSSLPYENYERIQVGYGWEVNQANVPILPDTIYTVSLSAAQTAVDKTGTARATVVLCNQQDNCNSGNGIAITLVGENSACWISNNEVNISFPPAGTDNQRESCSFTASGPIKFSRVFLLSGSGGDAVWIDNVQLEVGEGATDYTEYGTTNFTYLKKSPDYLYCNDPQRASSLCANYSPSCSASDVGCELYTPQNGEPAVPGVVKAENYCPAECADYSHYLKRRTPTEEHFNDSAQNTGVNMIASTGQSCTLADVGCEEFTDITNQEQKIYYSYLRMCVDSTDPNIATYYTWEGSDTTGFELKTWRLLKSDFIDDFGGVWPGPCTDVYYDSTAGKNICHDNVNRFVDNCQNNYSDPSCREYLDENNQKYFRKESRVVAASTECQKIRRTVNPTGPTDLAMILPAQSTTCSETVANCHEFKGNDGSNVRQVFVDDFEYSTNDWTGNAVSLSAESGVIGGHSLRVFTDEDPRIFKGVQLEYGRSYTLSFWAKSWGDDEGASLSIGAGIKSGNNFTEKFRFNSSNASIDLSTRWKKYEYGPIYYHYDSGAPTTPENLTMQLAFGLPNSTMYYIDNIVLKEISSDVYLIDNSWSAAAQCEPYLGCRAYTDRADNTHYLSSFYSVCQENKVGCQQFIDTKNSSYPFAKNYSAGNILKNSNFEGDYDYNGVPDGWNFWNNYADNLAGSNKMSVEYKANEGHNGSKYVKLSGDGYAPNGDSWIVANQYVAVKPNTNYYFSGYVRADWAGSNNMGSVELIAKLGIDKPRKSNPRVSYDIYKNSGSLGNSWTKVEKSFTTDNDTYGLEITCAMNNGTNHVASSFWCDDFQLGEALTESTDQTVYLVDDQQYYCSESAKGCTEMGRPTIGLNAVGGEEIKSWSEVNYLLDPDRYESILCSSESAGCEQYKSEGQVVNVKNPGANTCTYLNNFIYNGTPYEPGWYKTYSIPIVGSTLPAGEIMKTCAQTDNQPNPSLPRRTDDNWQGYAGLCDAKSNGCTELVDPQATQGQSVLDNGDFEQESDGILTTNYNIPDFWYDENAHNSTYELYNLKYYNGINWTSVPWDRDKGKNKGRDQGYGISLKASSAFLSGDYNIWLQKYLHQKLSFLQPQTTYNVSVDLKKESYGLNNDFLIGVSCKKPIKSIDNSFVDSNPSGSKLQTITIAGVTYYTGYKRIYLPKDASSDYNTYSFKFNTVESNSKCYLLLFGALGNGNIWTDNVRIQPTQSYYYINSNQINEGDCNGQVSWDKGCIAVLDKSNVSLTTGELAKSYNSVVSYQKSVQNNGAKAPAQTCTNQESGCDSNRIIKVRADRECGEWLSCSSWSYYTDQQGNVVPSCYDLNRCQQLDPENPDTCLSWVDQEQKTLTKEVYQGRQVGWSGMEYSSYSILNTYPLDGLVARNVDASGQSNNFYLTYIGKDTEGKDNKDLGQVGENRAKIAKSCRLYPEQEAPFVAAGGSGLEFDEYSNITNRPATLNQANFCQSGENCECDYYKTEYTMGETRFYSLGGSTPNSIIYDDHDVLTKPDPISKIKKKAEYRGWWGYCLEQDKSRKISGSSFGEYPCTTWMPLDMVTGDFNIFGGEAANSAWPESLYYCAVAKGAAVSSVALKLHQSSSGWRNYYNGTDSDDPIKCDLYRHDITRGDISCDGNDISTIENKDYSISLNTTNIGQSVYRDSALTSYKGDNNICVPDLKGTYYVTPLIPNLPDGNQLNDNGTQVEFKRVFSATSTKTGNLDIINMMPDNITVNDNNKLDKNIFYGSFVLNLQDKHESDSASYDVYARCFITNNSLSYTWEEVVQSDFATLCNPSVTGDRAFALLFYYVKHSGINTGEDSTCDENSSNGFALGTMIVSATVSGQSWIFADGPMQYAYDVQVLFGTPSADHDQCTYIVEGKSPKTTVVANGIPNFLYPFNQGIDGFYGALNGKENRTLPETLVSLQPQASHPSSGYKQADTVYGSDGYQVEWDGTVGHYGVDLDPVKIPDPNRRSSILLSINNVANALAKAREWLEKIFNNGNIFIKNNSQIYVPNTSWSTGPSVIEPPVVHPVEFNQQKNEYLEKTEISGFSINNTYNQDIVRYGHSYNATMNFYAYAKDEQSPLARLYIDWSDGNVVDYTAPIRNHKPICSRYCTSSDMMLDSYDIGSFAILDNQSNVNPNIPKGWQADVMCGSPNNAEITQKGDASSGYFMELLTRKGASWAGLTTTMPVVGGKRYRLSFEYQTPNSPSWETYPKQLVVQSYCAPNTTGCSGADDNWISPGDIIWSESQQKTSWEVVNLDFRAKYSNEILRIFIPYDMCKSSATGPTIDCSGGAGCAPGMWSNTYDDPRK
ncbi:MAG: hypothetical protein COX77_01040, partial [Candidatus Komeilibacteria bacterium CG_4_10_14_0_2_um_filter_37_10]